MCAACCGFLLLVLVILAIVLRYLLMSAAGPAALPSPQTPEGQMVLNAKVPFNATELNSPGPVRTTYIAGMQQALNANGTGGSIQVLNLTAAETTESGAINFLQTADELQDA